MNYQQWLKAMKDFGYNLDQFWWDCTFHYWLRTGTFDFLCGAYGVMYETVICGIYFRLYSYNQTVAGHLQHLITHVDGSLTPCMEGYLHKMPCLRHINMQEKATSPK